VLSRSMGTVPADPKRQVQRHTMAAGSKQQTYQDFPEGHHTPYPSTGREVNATQSPDYILAQGQNEAIVDRSKSPSNGREDPLLAPCHFSYPSTAIIGVFKASPPPTVTRTIPSEQGVETPSKLSCTCIILPAIRR
jgi:hypothetical protein